MAVKCKFPYRNIILIMCCSPFFKTCRRAILFQRNVVNYAIFVYLFLKLFSTFQCDIRDRIKRLIYYDVLLKQCVPSSISSTFSALNICNLLLLPRRAGCCISISWRPSFQVQGYLLSVSCSSTSRSLASIFGHNALCFFR